MTYGANVQFVAGIENLEEGNMESVVAGDVACLSSS